MKYVLNVDLQEFPHLNALAQKDNLKITTSNANLAVINVFHAQEPLTIVTLVNALTEE
jgi:hypothetical protein